MRGRGGRMKEVNQEKGKAVCSERREGEDPEKG